MHSFTLLTFVAAFSLVLSLSLPACHVPQDKGMAQLEQRSPEAQYFERDESTLSPRQWGNAILPPFCVPVPGWDWGIVWISDIQPLLTTLYTLNEESVTINPNVCQSIWCNSYARVEICNGNGYMLEVEGGVVADRIQVIIDSCHQLCAQNGCGVGGQVFDTANWNLVLKGGVEYGCGGSDKLKERNPEIQNSQRDDSKISQRLSSAGPYLPPFCLPVPGWNWGIVRINDFQPFMNDLRTLHEEIEAFPNQCTMIWCNGNARIEICSGNNFLMTIDSGIVADRIQSIIDSCPQKCSLGITCGVGGQIFDSANWNLVLKGGADYACGAGVGSKERSLLLDDSSEAEDLSGSGPQRRSALTETSSRSMPGRKARSVPRMEPVTFKGTYGGHAYEMNGTVTEVNARLKELYPDVQLPEQEKRDLVNLLEPRNPILPCLCVPVRGQPWGNSNQPTIERAVNDLTSNDHMLSIGADTCGTIWCDWGSSVVLCQGNPVAELGSRAVSEIVTEIMQQCAHKVSGWWPGNDLTLAGGQQFDTDGFNVILKGPYDMPLNSPYGGCGSGF